MDRLWMAMAAWRSRRLGFLVTGFTLALFAAAVLLVSLRLRQAVREQILRRDGAVLSAVALMQQYADQEEGSTPWEIDNPMDQLMIMLDTSRIEDVLAIRLFDENGSIQAVFPPDVVETRLARADLESLIRLETVSRFHPRTEPAALFEPAGPSVDPDGSWPALLEVIIPIFPKDDPRLVGAAQFFMDGSSIAEEFARLDAHGWRYGLTVLGVLGGAMAAALGWAFQRMQHANRLLAERSSHLALANQQLTLQAKMGAVGALTANLLHGLKNPLAGLRTLAASRSGEARNGGSSDDGQWRDVADAAGRMQELVNETVRILREENGVAEYELTFEEMAAVLRERILPLAAQAGLELQCLLRARGAMSNREANLVLLILENLLRNAIHATPRGRQVRLRIYRRATDTVMAVEDQGPGIPEAIRDQLFVPGQSTKPGGTGLGLALSRALARQMGAEVRLEHSGVDGSVFALILPADRLLDPAGAPANLAPEPAPPP